jgi:predicted PurR-regulated permease PerM
MVWPFLLTILLAAIFSGLSYPVYRGLLPKLGGRPALTAVVTLLLVFAIVALPVGLVLAAGANEALRVTETVKPALERIVKEPRQIDGWLRALPGYSYVEPYREQLLMKAAELAGSVSTFLFSALSATTRATALFFFHFAVLLYTMFFFLIGGPRLLKTMFSYLPLPEADKQRMLEKFVSVTRATLKGTVLICAAQGTLTGLALWVLGIDAAILLGMLVTVLSVIPGIGGALVWVPAAVYLAVNVSIWKAIALALWCSLVVGTVDNLLRPRLVGHDTKMHDLMIFFSTLGGLSLFGAMGFILGPILAALFVTVWEMFGIAFHGAIVSPADPLAEPETIATIETGEG